MTENHGLVVGDEVAIEYNRSYSIRRISKITPSGRIKLENSSTELNPDLSIRGADRWGPHRAEIVTPEIREAVERTALLHQISRVNWEFPSTDKLRRIVGILNEDPKGR